MKNNFVVGNKYYIKITQENSEMSSASTDLFALVFTSVKYRISGGTWISASNILISKISNGYIRILVSGNPVGSIETDSYFEIVGTLGSIVSFDYSLSVCKAVQQYTIANPIEIELDNLNCEPHVVSKTSGTNLLYVDTAYGVFREEQNVLTPSIVIEYSKVPDFNYVYIPSLSRYYFVTGITLVRYGVYRIDLKVDVLCTYDSDIRLQSGFVSRNESRYTPDYPDDRFPVGSIYEYNWIKASIYDTPNYNCKNVSFDQETTHDDSTKYHWVITCLNTKEVEYQRMDSPTNSNLPKIGSVIPSYMQDTSNPPNKFYSHYHMYLIGERTATTLHNALIKDDTKASYIFSFIWYPFDVKSINITEDTAHHIYIGNYWVSYNDKGKFEAVGVSEGTAVSGYKMLTSNMQYCIIADFTYTINNVTIHDREPISYYEMWIPYVGFIKVNSWDIINTRIIVYYAIDIYTGLATAYVKKWGSPVPLFSKPCQIGVKIPIATTNIEELTREKQNNALNLSLGLVGAGVSTAIGVATENPLAVVSGVLSASKVIASAVNSNNMLFERAQTNFYSAETSNFAYIKDVYIRRSYHDTLPNFNLSTYKHTQGLPLNIYVAGLSSLTGYTEIPEMHYIPSTYKFITKTEIDEIISLAKNGIIL